MPISLKIKQASLLLLSTFTLNTLALADSNTDKNPAKQTDLTAEFVYKYLVGELAGQKGDVALASSIFYDLAKSSRDSRLAERSAKAAMYANKPKQAIQATTLWAELDPESVEAQQAITQMLVSTGKVNDTKPYLQKLLAKENTRANGFLYLSDLFNRQSDRNAVLALVQDLAKPYPNLAEAHFAIARSAFSADKNELAISELNIADKLNPGWIPAAILHGQVLFSNSPESSIDFYKSFLTKYPNASDVRLNLARLYVSLKKYSEAKPEFAELVKTSKGNPDILVMVGLLSFQSGEYQEASQYLQQALTADFKDKNQIFQYLAQIAEKQNDDTEAMYWYQKIKPGERYLEAKFGIANIIARTKGTDEAIKMLDGLEELTNEQQALVLQVEASLLNQAKRHQEAYDLLENAVRTLPSTPELIYDFAMSAERTNRLDVMEAELRKLIQIKPDYAAAYNALGYSLADRNLKLDEAESMIAKALSLNPQDHYIMDSMGWLYYRKGDLDKALDFLKKAYQVQNDPEIAAHLGEVLWQLGKHEDAKKTWNEALKNFPDNELLMSTSKRFVN